MTEGIVIFAMCGVVFFGVIIGLIAWIYGRQSARGRKTD